jgi:hypothetical protein
VVCSEDHAAAERSNPPRSQPSGRSWSLFGLSDELRAGLFFGSSTLRDVSKRDHRTAAVFERNWSG